MSQILTVSEKYSRYWPAIAIGSIIISILLFVAYIMISDVLIGSYLRLAAFAFFVIGFLSFFKLRDGRIQIDFELKDDAGPHLDVLYSVRDRIIHSETIDISEITGLKVDQMPNRSLYNDFNQADRSVRFQKENMDGWLYLNEIHGRVIPLSKENAEKIVQFIKKITK
ncbi:hypothetical protein BH23BAC3_BH23BAC3_12410 [soil metagenome]